MQIGITGVGSISALGNNAEELWDSYQNEQSFISFDNDNWVCKINDSDEAQLFQLQESNKNYQALDRSVLLAMIAGQRAKANANWGVDKRFGINVGSSRGATNVFEEHHQYFLENKKAATLSSPSTTLGNVSYWLANHLNNQGPLISHSITCSTAAHAVLNAVAWLKSGMSNAFLVGGTEAPLTPFTIAQMKALRIYASPDSSGFPCRALDLEKEKNTMVLGEGASCFCIEKNPANPLAWIKNIGYGKESIEHATYLSKQGQCIQESMQMAVDGIDKTTVDIVITHTPGTRHGDKAEYNAIKNVFGNELPFITCNKWKIGHTLGASGAFSLEMGVLMIQHNKPIGIPYLNHPKTDIKEIKNVLVNAVGFGGNAVSILLSKDN